MRLQVSNGVNTDETVLFFNSKASNALDMYDSPKMSNNLTAVPEIYTRIGADDLVINGMNQIQYDTKIPLGFSTLQANSFTIKISELNNFDANAKIILVDNELRTEQDLTNGMSYNFESGITNTNERFSLIFKTSSATMDVANIEKLNGQVFVNTQNHITIIVTEKAICNIFDFLGQKQYQKMIYSPKETVNETFSSGVYFVELLTNGKREVTKVVIR